MGNSVFQFKKFTIQQDLAAMKVGTDGVLLGAWVDISGVSRILDVGTGTGLIAIMCAQRNSDAIIDAVEMEEDAVKQATINFEDTPWNDRLRVFQSDFKYFKQKELLKYDLIVSNPPFFIDSLKNDCDKKSKARHANYLSHEKLIEKVKDLLVANGRFSVVLPSDIKVSFVDCAKNEGLFLNKVLYVMPTPIKEPKRVLMEFSFEKSVVKEEYLIVEEFGRHGYSEDYKNLTSDFYLKF